MFNIGGPGPKLQRAQCRFLGRQGHTIGRFSDSQNMALLSSRPSWMVWVITNVSRWLGSKVSFWRRVIRFYICVRVRFCSVSQEFQDIASLVVCSLWAHSMIDLVESMRFGLRGGGSMSVFVPWFGIAWSAGRLLRSVI